MILIVEKYLFHALNILIIMSYNSYFSYIFYKK